MLRGTLLAYGVAFVALILATLAVGRYLRGPLERLIAATSAVWEFQSPIFTTGVQPRREELEFLVDGGERDAPAIAALPESARHERRALIVTNIERDRETEALLDGTARR